MIPKIKQNSKKTESDSEEQEYVEEDKSLTNTCKICKIDRLQFKLADDVDTTGALITFN